MKARNKSNYPTLTSGSIIQEEAKDKTVDWKIGALIGAGTNNQFYEITNLQTKKEYGVKIVLKRMFTI